MTSLPSTAQRLLLVVHQGAEMYGSDRSLLELLGGLDRRLWHAVVCLPEDGPLARAMADASLEVHVLPLVKVGRTMFSPRGVLALPLQLSQALTGLDRVLAGRPVTLVYTNTLAVWAGALWARRRGVRHVWHVREIIRRPAWVGWSMRRLAQALSARLICNSEQTRAWLDAVGPGNRSVLVWNGIEEMPLADAAERASARLSLGIADAKTVFLLVGRINAFKGQDLLLESAERMASRGTGPFAVLMVGGPPPGQPGYRDALSARVQASPISGTVQLHDFSADVRRYYAAADVVVVPSREPESFGRVAVEAMALGLPVVAAAHGGICEIVEHGKTGLLVRPNDATSLAEALTTLTEDAALRQRMGEAARVRQQQRFSLQACRAGVWRVFDEALA